MLHACALTTVALEIEEHVVTAFQHVRKKPFSRFRADRVYMNLTVWSVLNGRLLNGSLFGFCNHSLALLAACGAYPWIHQVYL